MRTIAWLRNSRVIKCSHLLGIVLIWSELTILAVKFRLPLEHDTQNHTFFGPGHDGTDFEAPRGTGVYAAASGYLIQKEGNLDPVYPKLPGVGQENGNYVRLYHGIDEDGRAITSVYLHLQKGTVTSKEFGTFIECGEKIGQVSNTGYVIARVNGGEGIHLHFEVKRDGQPFDPGGFGNNIVPSYWNQTNNDIPTTQCDPNGITKLVPMDKIKVVDSGDGLHVRHGDGCVEYDSSKDRRAGDLGFIRAGPVYCVDHILWEIEWERDGLIGWSAHPWLEKVISAEVEVEETPGSDAGGFVKIFSFIKRAFDTIKSFFSKNKDVENFERIPTQSQIAANTPGISVYSFEENVSVDKVISNTGVLTFDQFLGTLTAEASTVTKTTGFGIAERTVYTVDDTLVVIDEPLPELFKIDVGPTFCSGNQTRIHVSIPFVKYATQFDIYDRLSGSVLHENADRDHTLIVNSGQDYQIYVKATGEFGNTESVNTEDVSVSPEICAPGAMAGIQNLEVIPAPGHDDKIRLTWSDTMPWTAEYVFEVWNQKELVFTQTVGSVANSDTISMDIPVSGGRYYIVAWIRERDGSNSSAKFVSDFVDIQGDVLKKQLPAPVIQSITSLGKTITINFDGELQQGQQFIVDIESEMGSRDKIVLSHDSSRDVLVKLGDGNYDVSMHSVDPSGTFLSSEQSDVLSITVQESFPVPDLPNSPVLSAATEITMNSFKAHWNPVETATGFRLDVSTSSTFNNFVTGYENVDVGKTLHLSVGGLNANTTYYYRLRAYGTGGLSVNSSTITVTTIDDENSSGEKPKYRWQWYPQHIGSGASQGRGIVLDTEGNSYVLGHFSGNTTFPNNSKVFDGGASKDLFIAKIDQNGNTVWIQSAGGDGGISDNGFFGTWIAIDTNNNVLVTGKYTGTVTFGETKLTANGSQSIFIAKFSGTGELLWARNGEESGNALAYSIAVDSGGDAYIGGYFANTANFFDRVNNVHYPLNTAFSEGPFIAKFDSNTSEPIWAVVPDLKAKSYVLDLKLDGNGIGYATGQVQNNGLGAWDVFVASFNTINGALTWPSTVQSAGSDSRGVSLDVDGAGNVYVSGIYLNDSFSFGTSTPALAYNGWNVFNSRINPDGESIWTTYGGGDEAEYILSSAVNSIGETYLSGWFYGTSEFGDAIVSEGSRDIFVAKCRVDGQFDWALSAGGILEDEARSIAVDSNGNVYLTGSFQGSSSFGSTIINGSTQNNAFVAKLGNQETKQDQSVNFNPPSIVSFGDPPVLLEATASSGLPVSFTVVSGPGTINGNTLNFTGAGNIIVKASQEGDNTHHSAPDVFETVTVLKAQQSISFDPPESIYLTDSPFRLEASASSRLPVTFAVIDGPASVNNGVLTVNDIGFIELVATQSGNDNFFPAIEEYTVIQVEPAIAILSPPTGLTASDGTSKESILLQWNAVALADEYEIWRGDTESSNSAIALDWIQGTEYMDTRIESGKVYWYWIKAGRTDDTMAYSDFSEFDSGFLESTPTKPSQEIPLIVWDDPQDIVYGTVLSEIQYDAKAFDGSNATVAGSFAYEPEIGTLLDAGINQELTVIFNPDNTDLYITPVSKVVNITVLKADPVISWLGPFTINNGEQLGNEQLNATANIPGRFIYTPSLGEILSAGEYRLLAVFIPEDRHNYNQVSAEAQLHVAPKKDLTIAAILQQDGLIRLQISGVLESGSYLVKATEKLGSRNGWKVLAKLPATSGMTSYVDKSSPSMGARFYKVDFLEGY